MWQLDNRTPFAAGQSWIRDRNGAEVWLVVVKCTYDINRDGTTAVSRQQPPVIRVPEYNGEPGKSSIRFDSEFVLTKTTTDVVVVGHARAPDGKPVREMEAGFSVGPVRKRLRVKGNRIWRGTTLPSPEPFTVMPLVYERSFGGADLRSDQLERDWEWRNPVGTGFAVSSSHIDGRALPNIEYPDQLVQSWNDQPNPAGFGVIGSSWKPRAIYAGTYDAKWAATRQPLLPLDLDDRFFQSVPADQQASSFLTGGEPAVLLNLGSSPIINFKLPAVELVLETQFLDGERREHEAPKLHSVILETDFPRISLVWHSALECHAKVYSLDRTRISVRHDFADEGHDADVESLLDVI